MSVDHLTRRLFLQSGASTVFARVGLAGLAAIAESACTSRDESAAFAALTAADARELEAIAARIIPTTDTPGAREAGVIWFMDKAYDSFDTDYLPGALEGLANFQASIAGAFPGAQKFSDLNEAEQDAYLETQQDSGFFDEIRFMTILGFFAMSKYGGNRDDVGWKLVGLGTQHHGWQPPFGYYDAEYAEGAGDGE